MKLRSSIISSLLAVSGISLSWFAGAKLDQQVGFDFRPNPLGLKNSPYGQVMAMAIQKPIDSDWHGALEVHDLPPTGDDHGDASEVAQAHGESDHAPGCGHGSSCRSCQTAEPVEELTLLQRLARAVNRRTNPNPPTPGHQFYIRREIEKKLRFAYELDPSHYGNYNAYHLFLTESELGTSDEARDLTRQFANSLAEQTIRYCLRESDDPRPALTASSAAYNILEAMFMNEDRHTTQQMREQLTVLDFCLKRHFDLLEASSNNGTWDRISENRQKEILDRSNLGLKLREAAEKTIIRIENSERSTASIESE